jgi:hypothetical protein
MSENSLIQEVIMDAGVVGTDDAKMWPTKSNRNDGMMNATDAVRVCQALDTEWMFSGSNKLE